MVLPVSQKCLVARCWWLCLRSVWSLDAGGCVSQHTAAAPQTFSQRNSPACRAKLMHFYVACLQAALSANVLYYFVVDGFNGAAGTWAIDIEAMDSSTVAGQLISGTYALAEYSASGNSTNSEPACACCMPRAAPTACCACCLQCTGQGRTGCRRLSGPLLGHSQSFCEVTSRWLACTKNQARGCARLGALVHTGSTSG